MEIKDISKRYELRSLNKTIMVNGSIFEDKPRTLTAKFKHHEIINHNTKSKDKMAEFPINRPNKSKLDRKIMRYLYSQYK